MNWKSILGGAAMAAMLAPAMAQADSSLGAVEGARAKERQGAYLSPQDRENLRRYGGNDDDGPRYGYGSYGYGDGYYGDSYGYGRGYARGVSLYLGD
jgi:hypothetical protein